MDSLLNEHLVNILLIRLNGQSNYTVYILDQPENIRFFNFKWKMPEFVIESSCGILLAL